MNNFSSFVQQYRFQEQGNLQNCKTFPLLVLIVGTRGVHAALTTDKRGPTGRCMYPLARGNTHENYMGILIHPRAQSYLCAG